MKDNKLTLEEIQMWNEMFPLFHIDNDDIDMPFIHFKDIPRAHILTFEYSLGSVRVKDSRGYFAMILNDHTYKSYRGKFYTDRDFVPEAFYFRLLDMNIKIFNNNLDIPSLIRRWKIHNITT